MTLIAAHRGASADAAENTVEAMALAVDQLADWVEFDVRRTRDDRLVVHHDPHLPDGRIIIELELEELPSSVATFADCVAACGSLGLDIEIKSDPVEPDYDPEQPVVDLLIAELAGLGLKNEHIISSFDVDVIERVRVGAPHLGTGLLVFKPEPIKQLVDRCEAGGHAHLLPWHPLVDRGLVDAAHDAGLTVGTWTANEPDDLARVYRAGVDMIVTNHPAAAREQLGL